MTTKNFLSGDYYFMNKSELVASVQEHLGAETSKATAERAVEAVLEGLKKGNSRGPKCSAYRLRTFSVTERAAREGINPQTREKIQIKASKSVKFKAGAGLKALV